MVARRRYACPHCHVQEVEFEYIGEFIVCKACRNIIYKDEKKQKNKNTDTYYYQGYKIKLKLEAYNFFTKKYSYKVGSIDSSETYTKEKALKGAINAIENFERTFN